MCYEGVGGGIAESTYRIKPGADVGNIRLKYRAETELQKDGFLKIKLPTDRGWLIESKPVAWQEIGNKRIPVEVAFKIEDEQLGFRVAEYDRNRDLIIDPTYQWHTFYGSGTYPGDYGDGIALDGNGNVYITGHSDATWNGPGGQSPLNAYSGNGFEDIFVLKLNGSGAYQWHTFYGTAANAVSGTGIAVDGSGNVYVTGASGATWNGPGATAPLNAYSGGSYNTDILGFYAIFVLKLNGNGAYQWHTFYGPATGDVSGGGVAVDGSGNFYVTGTSGATWNGPGTTAPLNAYSGGSNGTDIFVLKLNTSGAYQWHSFYGSGYDYGTGIAVDGSGNVYVTGYSGATWNGTGATAPLNAYSGNYDIFVLKLSDSLPQAAVGISPTSQGFGGVNIGNSSPTQTFTVANNGTAGAVVSSISIAGANPSEFSIQNDTCSGKTLPVSGTCTVQVLFAPASNGAKSASLVVTYASNITVSASLTGTGVTVLHTLTVTKSNTSTGTGEVLSSPAGIDCGANCAASFTSGAMVSLTATPDAGSAFAGWSGGGCSGTGCTIIVNADTVVTATFTAVVAGIPKISVTPTSLNFGSLKAGSTSAPKIVTVKNAGKGSLIIDSISIAGTDVQEFGQTNSCTVISPGGSCTISVTFSPTSLFGKKSAIMSISSTDPKKPTINVQLLGQDPPPMITVSTISVNFGSVTVGNTSAPRVITIKDTGTSDLTVNEITLTGTNATEFGQTNSCSTVAKGGSCAISVTLSPTSAGSKSALVSISSNDPKKPIITVKLSGKGSGGSSAN